eukprot:TRINITY_DN10988_c0_g1_i1.p1 TRINITY_DN10988_c0_g1~~TRINITY_DN10988_c0_g1_i1.p1  ORF type:complete len:220 (+),score=59.14 TRINITY_DN10988_c0_g1_i1:60-662(+)
MRGLLLLAFFVLAVSVDDIKVIQVFRNFNTANVIQNDDATGDIAGMIVWIYQYSKIFHDVPPTHISLFNITANVTFGSYQLCTHVLGCGSRQKEVGRQVEYGSAGNGIWMSFNNAGYCAEGPVAGKANQTCHWGNVTLVKTIETSCPVANAEKFGLNYTKTDFNGLCEVFTAAFSSSDPSLGGCPSTNTSVDVRKLFRIP